jgi:hypothetical protein
MKFVRVFCSISVGAALAAACGGKALIETNEEATDAGGDGSSSAGSSSGSSSGSSGRDATTTTMPGFNVMCTSAQACPPSQVCCASFAFGGGGINVLCAASCGTGFQVCATDAECGNGQACGPSPAGVGMICQMVGTTAAPPPEAGAADTGHTDSGEPVDAGRPDATSLAPPDAATDGGLEAGPVDASSAPEAGPDASLVEAGIAEAAATAEASAPDDAESGDDGGDAGEASATQ